MAAVLAASPLLDPFNGELTRLAAVELIVLGLACGMVGSWVVLLGRAMLAESLTHALLPGLVLGAATGVGLVAGAALGTVAAFTSTAVASRAPRTSNATGTAVAVSTLVAIGALLSTEIGGAGLLEDLVFGDPLGIATRDIAIAIALALLVAGSLWALRRPLAALAFDRESLASLGLSSFAVEWAFLGLLSLTAAVSAFVAGSLLAPALMTGPALGVIAAGARAGRMPLYAGLVGAFSGGAGVYLSYLLDLPVSACVALCCALSALLPACARVVRSTSRRRRGSSRRSRPAPA